MGRIKTALKLIFTGKFSELIRKTRQYYQDVKNKHVVLDYPRTLMIEPTNTCNINCVTCPTGSGKMNRPKHQMTLEEYKSIIDQATGYTKEITLWGYGEPFLNKEILEMIHYSVDKGMAVITSTNGMLFRTLEYCQKIIKTGLQRLIVCIDGSDQRTLEKFRVNANYEKIVSGIKMLNEAKQQLRSETPKIEMQFIIMKHNEHQRETMQKLAEELKVSVYTEKEVGVDANDPDFQEKCKELLPSDLTLSRYYKKKDGTYVLKGTAPNYCSVVNCSTVINSDGSVIPCCYDLYSKHIMGNVFQDSGLKEVWKNKRYLSFRKAILKNRSKIPICKICSEGRRVSNRKEL